MVCGAGRWQVSEVEIEITLMAENAAIGKILPDYSTPMELSLYLSWVGQEIDWNAALLFGLHDYPTDKAQFGC